MAEKKPASGSSGRSSHGGQRPNAGLKPKPQNKAIGEEINFLDLTLPYDIAREMVEAAAAGRLARSAYLLNCSTTEQTVGQVQVLVIEAAKIIQCWPSLFGMTSPETAPTVADEGGDLQNSRSDDMEADRHRWVTIIRKIEGLLSRQKIAAAVHAAAAGMPPAPLSRGEAKEHGLPWGQREAVNKARNDEIRKVSKRAERAPSAAKSDFFNDARTSSTGGKKSHSKD